jgi:twinkle protein
LALPVYQPGQAEAYLQEKGWQFKHVAGQLRLRTCPFCNKTDFKFFIGVDNGLWICHHAKCARKGNFFQLLREMGDLPANIKAIDTPESRSRVPNEEGKRYSLAEFLPFEVNLADDPEVQEYITSKGLHSTWGIQCRGLTMETAQAWHLGTKDENGQRWLMIPYLTPNHEFADIKYRGLPDKRFRRLPGHESILFGEHTFPEVAGQEERPLYLVEGELDAITLWQEGFRPAVSTTTGAGSWKTRWYDAIVAYNPTKIFVIYDNDPAGEKGASDVMRKFDDRNCVRVTLPVKDCNEYFLTHTADEFKALLEDTPEPEVPNVVFLGSLLDQLETELHLAGGEFLGLKSQFPMVNELIGGGFANGDLVTVSGIPGVGKTTYVLQELLAQAELHNNPGYIFELEMPPTRLMRKIIEHKFHVPMQDQRIEHVERARKYLGHVKFAVGSTAKDLDEIERTVKMAVKRYDFRAIAFDNLNFFIRSADKVQQEISILTKRLKELAVYCNLPIFLIAQPRKFDDTERAMTLMDLKDSSSIAQDSDVVMLFWRRRIITKAADIGKSSGSIGSHSPITLCRVDKARYSAGGETYLYFDGAKSLYRELAPEDNKEKEAA